MSLGGWEARGLPVFWVFNVNGGVQKRQSDLNNETLIKLVSICKSECTFAACTDCALCPGYKVITLRQVDQGT